VQLVQVDALDAQAAQARLAGGAQVLGPAVGVPALRRRPHDAALGRDHEPRRVGMQCVGDQPLVGLGAVGVGRVDEVHAELDRTVQHSSRFVPIRRVAPDAGTGEPHRPVTEAVHPQVAANHDGFQHRRNPPLPGLQRVRRLT
jgi:hypothetical protein